LKKAKLSRSDMNLVLLKTEDFVSDTQVILEGRRFNHLRRVNRIKKADCLVCGLVNGKMGKAVVTEISGTQIKMQVKLDTAPPAPLPLNLVLALPRPKMLNRIIENATTLGVKKIFLINSWRVEKSFWQSPHLDDEHLKHHMILGLEQGRDTIMPEIHKKRFFSDFIRKDLPRISKDTIRITAHPGAENLCPSCINAPATLVIGPEGGFIKREIQGLENTGFRTYHIGSRILRVETAVSFLISRLYA